MKKNVLWITQTAIAIALLIVMQAVTASMGQLVTGSIVNLILIVSVMIFGLASGLAVSALSPIFAKLLGIGPLWELIPFIMLGNMVLVLLWHLIAKRTFAKEPIPAVTAAVIAAVAKFLTLYVTIVLIAVPLLLNPAKTISTIFSLPQLVTALIGGAVALVILPLLKKALPKRA
ncbi:MAG: hypothetical protein VB099_18720 [Candidatus Limiplasma sp.]|nr:hypothetical protein [Candidatus Limiplasma sp.]